jgi:hypothetical protein
MNLGTKSLLLLGLLLPFAATAQTVIPHNTTYPTSQPTTVTGTATVTNVTPNGSNTVTAPSGADVTFKAGTSITLGPGFSALTGSAFHALIAYVPPPPAGADSDNDGLPDDWEYLYAGSGDLTTLTGSGDNDGDSTNNLAEYNAGTNPLIHASTSTALGTAKVVIRAHGGTFKKVLSDWSITPVP